MTSLIETHDAFCLSPSILDLYRRGASDKLGVLWDTLHTYRHGEDPARRPGPQLGDRIKLVHVKDSMKATPEGFDFALTGEGTVPVMSFVDLLERKGFDGYVNFEWEKGWHRGDRRARSRDAALRPLHGPQQEAERVAWDREGTMAALGAASVPRSDDLAAGSAARSPCADGAPATF